MSDSFYKINIDAIAHETIDNEVVMVNLKNGSYYSLDKVGAAVWNYIDKGISQKRIVGLITNQYFGENSKIEVSIAKLFAELKKEELIILSDSVNNNTTDKDISFDSLEIEKKHFEKPVLQKFTDMQDLLLLDPIHDVDEMGWPKKSSDKKDQ